VSVLGIGYTDISGFANGGRLKVDARVKKYRAWLKQEGRPVWTDASHAQCDAKLNERIWAWSARAI
jgi:hypothetical protein